jgi:hypothetical protein
MLAALASLVDLAELIEGGVPPHRELRAGRNLLHASVTVRHAAGQPEGWAEDDDDPDFPVAIDVPDGIVMITLESAKRAFNNPTGFQSETQGDYAYTVAGGGQTYLTKHEVAIAQSHAPDTAASPYVTNVQLDEGYRRALRPRRRWGC